MVPPGPTPSLHATLLARQDWRTLGSLACCGSAAPISALRLAAAARRSTEKTRTLDEALATRAVRKGSPKEHPQGLVPWPSAPSEPSPETPPATAGRAPPPSPAPIPEACAPEES